jgi:hypothetical protein
MRKGTAGENDPKKYSISAPRIHHPIHDVLIVLIIESQCARCDRPGVYLIVSKFAATDGEDTINIGKTCDILIALQNDMPMNKSSGLQDH